MSFRLIRVNQAGLFSLRLQFTAIAGNTNILFVCYALSISSESPLTVKKIRLEYTITSTSFGYNSVSRERPGFDVERETCDTCRACDAGSVPVALPISSLNYQVVGGFCLAFISSLHLSVIRHSEMQHLLSPAGLDWHLLFKRPTSKRRRSKIFGRRQKPTRGRHCLTTR